MVKNILVVLLIVTFYLLIIYLNNISKEGMCNLDEYNYEFNSETNINQNITVYYGSIGSATVRVLPNGERIIINVDKNSDVTTSQLNEPMTFYNQNGDTIVVYKTLDGDFVISNDSQITDGSVETYYGNNGSVTVKINEDGTKEIIDYNTSFPNDVTSVQTFYGPNGREVNVIRTPDGTLKLVTASTGGTIVSPGYNRNDYVLKSQVVPPVCPTCPATTCANCNNDSNDETNDNSNADSTNNDSGSSSNDSSSNGSSSNESSSNGSSSNGSSSNTSSSNGSSSNDSSPNGLVYGDGTTDIISNGAPIGSYLGPVVGTPMPLLNDFSRFA